MKAEQNLYQKLLGQKFVKLAPVFQRLHANESPLKIEGQIAVRYSDWWLVKLIKPLIPIPPQGDYPLKLKVEKMATLERWSRWFGSHEMFTKQYSRSGLLLEQMGPFAFGFELDVVDGQLQMNFRRQYCLGMPLPRALSLKIGADVEAIAENSWKMRINLSLWSNTIVEYSGEATILD